MVVVDTGPLVAMANEQDRHHARCVDWFDIALRPLLMSAPILTLAPGRIGRGATPLYILVGLSGISWCLRW
jgi:hypothetical protein